jgi:predicted  nucleic acid-binding Zn-ribbon protein
MYQKQIEQLVLLQAIDEEILVIEAEIKEAPLELVGLDERVKTLKASEAQVIEKLDILKAQLRKLETEIEEDSLKVKKSKNKLMMVGNTKEYHAMMREMDSLEKLNRMREEERVAVTEEIARQEAALGELAGEVAGVQGECEAKRASLDERLAKGQKKLDGLGKKRKKAGSEVPPPILARYEFIRSRIPHPVIVAVDGGVCAGCHIKIPPQTYNELQKGKQIIGCPNCQRLVYWVEHRPKGE